MKEHLTNKLSFQDWMERFKPQVHETVEEIERIKLEFGQLIGEEEEDSLIGKLVRA